MLVDMQVITTPTKLQRESSEQLCKNDMNSNRHFAKYLDIGVFTSPSLSRITGILFL